MDSLLLSLLALQGQRKVLSRGANAIKFWDDTDKDV